MIEKEREIFANSFPTARNARDLQGLLDLPHRLSGLRMLDIGAGGSNLTDDLRKRGAEAYAIDPIYRRISVLKQLVESQLSRMEQDPDKRAYAARERNTLRMFLASQKNHPTWYSPRFATDTKFQSHSFDHIFSFNCITQYLALDYKTLIAAIRESLRIIKPGGRIEFFPVHEQFTPGEFMGDAPNILTRKMNIGHALQWLSEQPHVNATTTHAPGTRHEKLVIQKMVR